MPSINAQACLKSALVPFDSNRYTMRIHGQMYLDAAPPFVRLMS